MISKPTYHSRYGKARSFILAMLMGLIFIAQSFSLAHAARYSDAEHEHNGVVCEVMQAASEDVFTLPAPPVAAPLTSDTDITVPSAFISASYITPQGRAPPPRSPPSTF